MHHSPHVIARRDGRAGRILLNRPAALNALDLPMIRTIAATLAAWREDPEIHLVVIEGAGERAFCAGGDIRALRDHQLDGDRPPIDAFFTEEYALNAAIAAYPKPYVALIDGVCMGGGIGVSVHAPYRVATEHALFAMPETAIGFFPDIGASFFLPRLPGRIGVYLGLTGARVRGADAAHAGLATHFTPRAGLPALAQALAADGLGALAAHAAPLPPFGLAPHRDAIDRCFAAPTIPDLFARLATEGTAWAEETRTALRAVSPSALFWTRRLLAEGEGRTLAQCLAAEFALGRTSMRHPDFVEGVRAMVVDKDRTPRWSPARMEDVVPADIAALFD
ncbi:MAG: enoyl-CoA hydratase/isomerase family protein [Proteobacteria bacterium]|nr:enoyl-CoA hydratase/isomerase family protein [Pseudomonadota bacterium]